MDLILDEVKVLRDEFPKLPKLLDEAVFSLVCLRYFFNQGEFGYGDYRDAYTDGRSDGGIDLVLVHEKDGEDRLVLVQSKLVSSLDDAQDVVDIFTKMAQTVENFQLDRTAAYSKRLKRIYRDRLDSLENQPPNIAMIAFVAGAVSDERKSQIRGELEGIEHLQAYDISVFYRDDIERQIRSVKEPQLFVPEDKVSIAKDDGHITKGANGLLVNVSANSLRHLYDKYRDKGLFEQNFRYFIRNQKIDSGINESLARKRDGFWFLNNGIIIGCKDYSLDGDNVKLRDFSIVNGCQTVTLIGEYKGKNQEVDFVLPCKIVRPAEGQDYDDFITQIAEASNSQKPISDRDLKANKPEQKRLQKALSQDEPKIYLEIKRGESLLSAAKKKQIEPWQFVDNDYLGQVILAFHLQQPGTARSGKRRIFSSNNIYDAVFKRTAHKESIADSLRIFQLYREYVEQQSADDLFTDADDESVATNGKMMIPSIVGFMIKEKRGLLDTKRINNGESEWTQEVTKDCLGEGPLFADHLPDNYRETLFDLFTETKTEVVSLYKTREQEEKTVSNFFKTDEKYFHVILPYIVSKYYRQKIKQQNLKRDYLVLFA